VSNAPAWWVAHANTLATVRGWTPFVGLQIEYNLLERTSDRELIPMAAALGLGVLAWSPLANGLLGGRYRVTADGIRSDDGSPARLDGAGLPAAARDPGRAARVIEALKSVAGELDRPPAQVALAWLRQRPQPVIPIFGEHVASTLASLDLRLSDSHLRTLDEASAVDLGYPASFFDLPMTRDYASGGMRDLIDA
jgi:aryl-alcohol dehydrogenase-like predicted oxidoreductase